MNGKYTVSNIDLGKIDQNMLIPLNITTYEDPKNNPCHLMNPSDVLNGSTSELHHLYLTNNVTIYENDNSNLSMQLQYKIPSINIMISKSPDIRDHDMILKFNPYQFGALIINAGGILQDISAYRQGIRIFNYLKVLLEIQTEFDKIVYIYNIISRKLYDVMQISHINISASDVLLNSISIEILKFYDKYGYFDQFYQEFK